MYKYQETKYYLLGLRYGEVSSAKPAGKIFYFFLFFAFLKLKLNQNNLKDFIVLIAKTVEKSNNVLDTIYYILSYLYSIKD